jgi:uncharacterized protein
MERLYHIAGTHCRSCQVLLEQRLGRLPGVLSALVDYRTGKARVRIAAGGEVSESDIAQVVADAGYRLSTTPVQRTFFSHSGADWANAFVASCIVFVLYLIYRITGLDAVGNTLAIASSASGALVVGLVAGFSTCMALIGSLVLAHSARHAQLYPYATAWQRFRPNLVFNVGRVLGFALLGGFAGMLGGVLRIEGRLLAILVMLASVMMVGLGIKLTGLMPRLESITLPTGLARLTGLTSTPGRYNHSRMAITGMLTFFLPCAFTQTMQVLAVSTGSFLQGASIMAAFSLGTAPGLLGIGSIGGFARGEGGRMFMKVVGIAVLLLGIWNFNNGWNLTGITLGDEASATIAGAVTAQLPPIRDGVQVLQMNQWAGGYNPNKLVVRAGIPVRWEISADGTGCASYLIVPSLGIRKNLQPGVNVVEFTPKRTGAIKFSCGMGMFTGSIAVVK